MKGASRAVYSRSIDEPQHRLDISIREMGGGLRIRIEAGLNEVGVLFRVCSVLYAYEWAIVAAHINSPAADRISDEFEIMPRPGAPPVGEPELRAMVDDLESLLFGGLSVLDYLSARKASPPPPPPASAQAEIRVLHEGEQISIEIKGRDRNGLLLGLAQAFYLMDIDVREADIHTDPDGRIRNRFLVYPSDRRFASEEFCARLSEELRQLL